MNNLPIRNSYFLISLDFELMWGVSGSKTIKAYGENIKGVREVIPHLLTLFRKYDIHATWATVGFIFHKTKQSLLHSTPIELPSYVKRNHSNYFYIQNNIIGENEYDDPYHWGYSLLQKILQESKQEVASHTYSHYFCLEEGQNERQFELDIQKACEIAKKENIELTSIVFPRNQVNKDYLPICLKYGIKYYRGAQQGKLWSSKDTDEGNKVKFKILRFLDAYINISGAGSYPIPEIKQYPINLPGSCFLRPYNNKYPFLESLKMKRIKDGMTTAAKNGEVYHLWWHPHNFGINLEKNIKMLENILKHYSYLKSNYPMQNASMKELGKIIERL